MTRDSKKVYQLALARVLSRAGIHALVGSVFGTALLFSLNWKCCYP